MIRVDVLASIRKYPNHLWSMEQPARHAGRMFIETGGGQPDGLNNQLLVNQMYNMLQVRPPQER